MCRVVEGCAVSWADDMFDSAFRIADAMAKRVAEVREIKRQARLAKRRRRYAISKLVPKKPKSEPEPLRDYEPMTECGCSYVRMPPCSWCESGSGGNPDDE